MVRVEPAARTREVLGQLALVKFDLHNHCDFFVDIVTNLSYIRVASKMSNVGWSVTLRHSPLVRKNANTGQTCVCGSSSTAEG